MAYRLSNTTDTYFGSTRLDSGSANSATNPDVNWHVLCGPDGNPLHSPASNTATIASGQSLSSALNLAGRTPLFLYVPSANTNTFFTFQVSPDGTTFYDLFKDDGNEYQVASNGGRAIPLSQLYLYSVPYLKVRSGTRGSPAVQGSTLNLTLTSRFV